MEGAREGVRQGRARAGCVKHDHLPRLFGLVYGLRSRRPNHADKQASFYVGDAAGRKGDHASSDREWAQNVGIPFYTPEQFFWERQDDKAAPAE